MAWRPVFGFVLHGEGGVAALVTGGPNRPWHILVSSVFACLDPHVLPALLAGSLHPLHCPHWLLVRSIVGVSRRCLDLVSVCSDPRRILARRRNLRTSSSAFSISLRASLTHGGRLALGMFEIFWTVSTCRALNRE